MCYQYYYIIQFDFNPVLFKINRFIIIIIFICYGKTASYADANYFIVCACLYRHNQAHPYIHDVRLHRARTHNIRPFIHEPNLQCQSNFNEMITPSNRYKTSDKQRVSNVALSSTLVCSTQNSSKALVGYSVETVSCAVHNHALYLLFSTLLSPASAPKVFLANNAINVAHLISCRDATFW